MFEFPNQNFQKIPMCGVLKNKLKVFGAIIFEVIEVSRWVKIGGKISIAFYVASQKFQKLE
jgi:hypothetical protein